MFNNEHGFSFTQLFKPLTTTKAISIIVLIGIIVYFNSLFNGFVSDDASQIVDNSLVHSLSNTLLFFTNAIFLKNTGSNSDYRPIQSVLQTLIYTLSGSA